MAWAVEIEPGWWQGDWPRTPDDMRRWASVINVCAECADPGVPGLVVVHLPFLDDGRWAPPPVLWDTLVRLARQLPTPCLVHCGMGRSRSSAALIAILRDRHHWEPERALDVIRHANPAAMPNPALWASVSAWRPPD